MGLLNFFSKKQKQETVIHTDVYPKYNIYPLPFYIVAN